jgi:hypothetical protein
MRGCMEEPHFVVSDADDENLESRNVGLVEDDYNGQRSLNPTENVKIQMSVDPNMARNSYR